MEPSGCLIQTLLAPSPEVPLWAPKELCASPGSALPQHGEGHSNHLFVFLFGTEGGPVNGKPSGEVLPQTGLPHVLLFGKPGTGKPPS